MMNISKATMKAIAEQFGVPVAEIEAMAQLGEDGLRVLDDVYAAREFTPEGFFAFFRVLNGYDVLPYWKDAIRRLFKQHEAGPV